MVHSMEGGILYARTGEQSALQNAIGQKIQHSY